jgi:PAS domain S-box-containing protein
MNVFAFFDFVNIFLGVFLCAFVYFRNPLSKLSIYFLLISLVSCYCAFCEFFKITAQTPAWAIFWHKASFLWPFLPFVFYQFILVQIDSKLIYNKVLNLVIFLPGLLLAFLHLFTNLLYLDLAYRYYGWEYNNANNIYAVLVAVYFMLCGIFSVTITFNYYIKQVNSRKRKQCLYTLTGLSIPVLGGMITKGILPQFGIYLTPLVGLFYLIGSIFLAISILRYKSFSINPFDIIKNMFATSPDYLVIYDQNGEVVSASQSFLRCTAYSEEEIIGQKLNIFFRNGTVPDIMEFVDRIGKETELELITKNKKYIPVSTTTSSIQNYSKNDNFYLLLGRDLRDRKQFEKELIQFKIGLEEKVKIRTAELAKSNIDLHIEIHERKSVENALRESEKRYRDLFENSPIGIYRTTPDGKILLANPVILKMLGYKSLSEMKERNLEKEGYSELSYSRNEFKGFVETSETITGLQSKWIKKDGNEIFVRENAKSIRDNNGKVLYYEGTVEDITEQVKAIEALKESEERFRNLIENINEIFYISDYQGKTIYASPNIYNFTGYLASEWIGNNALKFVYERDLKRVLRFYIDNRNRGTLDASIEFRSARKDGSIFWVEQITRFVRNNIGELIEYRSVTRDITQRKIAEEKLQLLAQAVKSTSEGISITDTGNNIIFVNDAFIKMYGYSEEELIGHSIKIIHTNNNPEPLIEEVRFATIQGSWRGELLNTKKDGTEFPIYLSTSNVVDEKGNPYALVGITRDISERKKFEKAIKESEKRYRNLFNNSPLGIYRTSPDGKILLANPAIIKMLGYSDLQELIQRDLEQEGYDESSFKRKDFKSKIESQGEIKGIEVKWLKKDGSTIILRESAKCVRDENKEVLYYDGTVEDITEQVNALTALKESEEKFRTLSEKSPNVILIVRQGRILYMNEKCVEVFGYDKEYFTSPTFEWRNILTLESYEKLILKFGKDVTQFHPYPGEFTVISKDGKEVEVIVSTTPINYFGETVTMAILTDITERRNTEKQLQEYRDHLENLVAERTQKLDSVNRLLTDEIKKLKIAEDNIQNQLSFLNILLDTIPNPIYIRDSDRVYTGCNKAFEEFHGLKREEIIGKKTYDLIPPEVARVADEWDDKILNNPEPLSYEVTARSHKGKAHEVIIYKGMFNKADGTLGGIVGVILDITEIKQLQKEILNALDKEKDLNELKSRFISVASHEFRTPLTSILAAADLLELYGRDWPNEKYYEYLRNIQNAVIYMNELINDVLTVNKSESDKIKFNPSNIDLYKLFVGILDTTKLSAPGNIGFIFNYKLKQKLFILDGKLITQILINLLSNAIKYSPRGGNIVFTVTKVKKILQLSVCDEGIGIPEEDQNLLFEPFHRGQNVGAISGTGLGLSIVKKSVEIHQGVLEVRSAINKGTEVIITLPLN